MTDDEQEIKYAYDEQGRLIAAEWCEEPDVKVFKHSTADLDPLPDAIDLDPLLDSTNP